jgi:hypothetical protein
MIMLARSQRSIFDSAWSTRRTITLPGDHAVSETDRTINDHYVP